MQKIINRRTYNTETSELIGQWGNGYYSSDFSHCYEELYRTQKGTYFLYGVGGPMSSWAAVDGQGRHGNADIRLLTEEEAIDWCESKDQEALEKYFSQHIEQG